MQKSSLNGFAFSFFYVILIISYTFKYDNFNNAQKFFGSDMKKFSAIIFALMITLVFVAGCSATSADPFTRSGFLSDPSIKSVYPVSETNVYSVTFEENEKSSLGVKYVLNEGESSLKTVLSVVRGDGVTGEKDKDYYLFEVELDVEGVYTIDGVSTPASNRVSSKVYFCGTENSLRPVYSSRSADVVSLEGSDEKYKLTRYKYETETKYGEKNATVTVTPTAIGDEKYPAQGEYVIENVFGGNYVDNELLLFAPRAMDLDSTSYSQSTGAAFTVYFNTIDVLAKKSQAMRLAFSKDETIDFAEDPSMRGYANSSFVEPRTSVAVKTLTLSVNSDFAGASQTLSFASSKETNEQQRLISASYPATYNIGTFKFLIKSSLISL